MTALIQLMASPAGRLARIIAGIVLIVAGIAAIGGTAGIVVAVVGLVPLGAGILDICIFAPLFGCPLSGPAIRGGHA